MNILNGVAEGDLGQVEARQRTDIREKRLHRQCVHSVQGKKRDPPTRDKMRDRYEESRRIEQKLVEILEREGGGVIGNEAAAETERGRI